MSNTFCVTITHCKTDGDKATLGFVDFDDEEKVKEAWQRTVSRSPLVATLKKAVELQLKFVIV
jgi:hypothetical protein